MIIVRSLFTKSSVSKMYGASYNVVKTMYMLLHSAAGVKYKLQDETTVYCNANEYMKDHIFELGRNIRYYD